MDSFLAELKPIWEPHPGQREFLLHPAKFKVLACGRRWGKSDVCAVKIVHALRKESPAKHLIIAPTTDQSRLIFSRVIDLLESLGATGAKVSWTPYPKLALGPHRLTARSGKVGHLLRGQEATHIVVDEAAFVPEPIITEVAMPMLATTNGEMTLISTPNGQNHFWRFFQMGQENRHGIWSRRAPSSESPFVSEEFLARQRELVSERAFRVEYEADFMSSSGQVFRGEMVEAALRSDIRIDERAPISIGVDWARYHDATAVAVIGGTRANCALIDLLQWRGIPWREQLERIADVLGKYPGAKVTLDATGVGDPMFEMLREAAPEANLRRMVFTATQKNVLIEQLVWLFERKAIRILPDAELQTELSHYQATARAGGPMKLGAPSGFHDDLVTALALATHRLPAAYTPGLLLGDRRKFSRPKQRRILA